MERSSGEGFMGPPGSLDETVSGADYEAVLADHRRLVRELDVLLNGEAGAAMQASLCDIVGQVRNERLHLYQGPLPDATLALEETRALVVHMAKTFYPEVTQFRPFDELRSLVSQIDNMVCGLQRKPCEHVWSSDTEDHPYWHCMNCGVPQVMEVAPGHRHTRLLAALHDELVIQHPDAFFEDDDCHLVIPSGVTPQTAFVKIDTSALAEALLSISPASPQSDPSQTREDQSIPSNLPKAEGQ